MATFYYQILAQAGEVYDFPLFSMFPTDFTWFYMSFVDIAWICNDFLRFCRILYEFIWFSLILLVPCCVFCNFTWSIYFYMFFFDFIIFPVICLHLWFFWVYMFFFLWFLMIVSCFMWFRCSSMVLCYFIWVDSIWFHLVLYDIWFYMICYESVWFNDFLWCSLIL